MTHKTVILIFSLALSGTPLFVNAQALTYFGANNDARACYQGAVNTGRSYGRIGASAQRCNRALELGHLKIKDRAATYVNRGIVHVALKQYEAALKDYQHAANLKPEFAEIYVNRGNVYYLTRSFNKAVEQYNHALKMNISPPQIAYVNRGMSYEKLGDITSAQADYRKAIELDPEWEVAQSKLQLLLLKQRQKERSKI